MILVKSPNGSPAWPSAWCWRGAGGRCGPGRSAAEAAASVCSGCCAAFGASVRCVHIFHFVSSDTFRVKKSPKRSPLSDPPSQVYRSLDIYGFIPPPGVTADVVLFPTGQQGVASYTEDRPSVCARHRFDPCILGEISMCPESRKVFQEECQLDISGGIGGNCASPS